MLEHVILENALVLDIETVPVVHHFEDLSSEFQKLWTLKATRSNMLKPDETIAESYTNNAGIFAEFGKIVCISVGFFKRDTISGRMVLRVRSFASNDEKELLLQFNDLLAKFYNNPSVHFICGHNIKEFDIPYMCRRMIVHRIELPKILDFGKLKPWELLHLDTMQCWKFGDYKGYTSLRLLAALFDIPTPKDDIDGSDVGRVYWEEGNLDRIRIYCQKDVVTTARLLLRFKNLPDLPDEDLVII